MCVCVSTSQFFACFFVTSLLFLGNCVCVDDERKDVHPSGIVSACLCLMCRVSSCVWDVRVCVCVFAGILALCVCV